MDRYLAETPLVDWTHESIESLFTEREWDRLDTVDRARVAHDFVRDEIAFGYNRRAVVPASRVLAEGRGQCLTKATLLIALLRRAGIPCRFHAFAVDKRVQAGVMFEGALDALPANFQHGWVEALVDECWIHLEGYIVDAALLARLQARFADRRHDFCGYGIAVDDLLDPPNGWTGGDTFVQHRAICGDLGVFVAPDDFHAAYPAAAAGMNRLHWRLLYYTPVNRNVERIRQGDFPADAERFVSHCPRGMFPVA